MPIALTGPGSGFDFQPRTRLVFGEGSIDRLGLLARECGMSRVLLVTDAGLVAAGHTEHARRSLTDAGHLVTVFDGVRENPTTRDVDDCLEAASIAAIDGIVGFGGGSSMDTAKGCNFLLTNGGEMRDYWGIGKAKQPMLPLIAVPTTSGTGSECQSFALIADEQTHQKMACGDPKAAARIALLDPALTVSQPRAVTACTGIDAVAHALETSVTRTRNPLSRMHAREAFRLLDANFERVLLQPDDLDARAAMQLGAAFAGAAIELSMLGAAHAAANPLTAHFSTVHGQAVGMMLPHVIRFNAADTACEAAYRDLALAAGLEVGGSAGETLAVRVSALLRAAGFPRSLFECGVAERDIAGLAVEANRQWTARHNPREIGEADFAQLYRAALAN